MTRLGSTSLLAFAVGAAGCDDHIFPAAVVDAGTVDASWAGMDAFFAAHCDSCHPTVSGPDLRPAIEDDVTNGTGLYVVAGDPDASLLWQVLNFEEGVPGMPFGASALPDETLAPVEAWILAGAPLD